MGGVAAPPPHATSVSTPEAKVAAFRAPVTGAPPPPVRAAGPFRRGWPPAPGPRRARRGSVPARAGSSPPSPTSPRARRTLAHLLTEALELRDRHHVIALEIAEGERRIRLLRLRPAREDPAHDGEQQLTRSGIRRHHGTDGTTGRQPRGHLPGGARDHTR